MSCEEAFLKQLRERGFWLTPQREMVLGVMHELDGLATAEDIFQRVHAQSSSVDISTVYRTLDLLQDFHMVACVDPGDGQRRYELLGIHGSHYHLICRSCGKVIGADLEEIHSLAAHLGDRYGFQVDVDHLSVSGICQDCLASHPKARDAES